MKREQLEHVLRAAARIAGDPVPGLSLVAIAAALGLLILAALTSLSINLPRRQYVLDIAALRPTPALANWQVVNDEFTIGAYELRLQLLSGLRVNNRSRGRRLTIALALECLALLALAFAVGRILWVGRYGH